MENCLESQIQAANKLCHACDECPSDNILDLAALCARGNLQDSLGGCVYEKLVNPCYETSQALQAAIIESYGAKAVKSFKINPYNFLGNLCQVCNQCLATCSFSNSDFNPYLL